MAGLLDTLTAPLRHAGEAAWGAVERAVNEERIHLAVTGLSRAGKTVFITSLVENLLALAGGRDTLPALRARLEQGGIDPHGLGRLRSVRLLPAGSGALPRFDHEGHVAALAGREAGWPARTEDLAALSLEIVLDRASPVARALGPRRIRLDILDYPGEWLLDLPLIGMSFASWSESVLARLRTPARAGLAGEFLRFLDVFDPGAPADEALIRRGHALYRAALEALRGRMGLRYLQPGRFLNPGPRGEVPLLWFFPVPLRAAPRPGSGGALLTARFEAYREDMRTGFFEGPFRAFDRQILLVDVLGALHAGRAAFEDTADAIADLCRGLRGAPGWFGWGSAPIARVAVVATKADHVPALRREALRHLLRALVERGLDGRPGGNSDGVSLHVAAAIHATRDDKARLDGPLGGRDVEVVLGVPVGEDRARPYFVGDVPAGWPPEGFWGGEYFELPVFRPPRIAAANGAGVPHIGLDGILVALLGDRL